MDQELIFQILWLIFIAIIIILSLKKKKQSQEQENFRDLPIEAKKEIKSHSQVQRSINMKALSQEKKEDLVSLATHMPEEKISSFKLNFKNIKDGFIFSVILDEPKAYKFIKKIV